MSREDSTAAASAAAATKATPLHPSRPEDCPASERGVRFYAIVLGSGDGDEASFAERIRFQLQRVAFHAGIKTRFGDEAVRVSMNSMEAIAAIAKPEQAKEARAKTEEGDRRRENGLLGLTEKTMVVMMPRVEAPPQEKLVRVHASKANHSSLSAVARSAYVSPTKKARKSSIATTIGPSGRSMCPTIVVHS